MVSDRLRAVLMISLMILNSQLAMVKGVSTSSSAGDTASAILLEFRALLVDPTGALKSWTREGAAELCTAWEGIMCNDVPYANIVAITGISLPSKNLSGTLSPALGLLSSLRTLNLSNNALMGEIPAVITDLTALTTIDLSNNNFSGNTPSGFSRLPHLETLSLWSNSLMGPIPRDIVACLKLQHLDLGGNYLEGHIPHAIGNLTNLVFLTLAGNELHGELPPSLTHLKKLQWLFLGYNQLTGSIPPGLGDLSSLKLLDVAHNDLTGEFPHSITNLSNLEHLFLYDNEITGIIPPAIANLRKLYSLDLSNNMMSGTIPSGISNLKQLQTLNLFLNKFRGGIPKSIAAMETLRVLALWMNELTGEVPAGLGLKNNLTLLDLSSNRLIGAIPEHLCASRTLRNLILFSNSMSGPIPGNLATCHSLERVRLELNHFSGNFPHAFTSLPLVYYLDLSYNNLSGRLDTFSWNMPALQVLRLGDNGFSGTIPHSLPVKSRHLVNLDLSRNALSGPIPPEVCSLVKLTELLLGGNLLSGDIQRGGILHCTQLVELVLSNNQLTGPIPSELANMRMLTILDLSHNRFSGVIPPSLGDMESLVLLNLSFNLLVGPIPLSGVFIQINASAIEGNSGLCGGSLAPCIPFLRPHPFRSVPIEARVTAIIFLIGLLIVAVGIGNVVWNIKHGGWMTIALFKSKAKAWGEWELKLFGALKIAREDVLIAIQEEHVVDKKSCCGVVYKGSTKGGTHFAAMEMITGGEKHGAARTNLEAVLAVMGKARHPNVVNVYGICTGAASVVMLFELVEGCRLSSLLQLGHDFCWSKRFRVAADIASAVIHLHGSCSPPIIHGAIRSSNIVVDMDLRARLLLPMSSSSCGLVNSSKGNCGARVDPGSEIEDDIRAFGKLMLELLAADDAGGEAGVHTPVLELKSSSGDQLKALARWLVPEKADGEAAEAAAGALQELALELCRAPTPSGLRRTRRVLQRWRRRQLEHDAHAAAHTESLQVLVK